MKFRIPRELQNAADKIINHYQKRGDAIPEITKQYAMGKMVQIKMKIPQKSTNERMKLKTIGNMNEKVERRNRKPQVKNNKGG